MKEKLRKALALIDEVIAELEEQGDDKEANAPGLNSYDLIQLEAAACILEEILA